MPIFSVRLSTIAMSLVFAYPYNVFAQDSAGSAASLLSISPVQDLSKQSKDIKANDSKTKADKPSDTKTQKVEVKANREYDARRFDTASKIVFSQDEIARYGDTDITDVLKRLPSVSVVGGAIRMRGLGSGYTQILLNGEPSPPGFSIESISPDLIERIEIVRSASAEFSTQAIAGTINIVLKKSIQLAQRIVKLGYYQRGDLPSGMNSSFQLSDKIDHFSYSLPINVNAGRYRNGDNFSDTQKFGALGNLIQQRDTQAWNNNHNRSMSMAPRLNWSFENEDSLSLQTYIGASNNDNQSRVKTDSVVDVESPPYPFVFEDYNTRSENQNANTNLTWVHRLDDSAKIELRAGGSYSHSISAGDTIGRDGNESLKFDRHVNSESINRSWNTSGKYTVPFIEDHAVSTGWELSWRRQNSNNVTRGTSPTQEIVAPISLDEDIDFRINRSAWFVQDEWTLNKQFSAYLGARWEAISMDGKGNHIDDVHNRSAVWSPIFQTLYKIPEHSNQQIRFALSRTYKGVNSWDLIHRRYYSTNNSSTSPDSLANPNLQPELATGFDVGFEHFVDGGGVFSANFFLRKISGITLTRLFLLDGSWVVMPINAGHATTKGLELEAKFPLRMWIDDAPAFDFRMNAGFNHSSIDTVPGPNNRLDSQVPIRINAGVDYKAQSMPLTLGAGFAFQNAGVVRLSDSQTSYGNVNRGLDAYALWKFDQTSNLRLSLSNIIRYTAFSRSIYADAKGSTIRQNTNPAKLNIRLNYEYRF